MATAGGHRPLNDTMATINVPGICKKSYIKIENKIGASWRKILADDMLATSKEGKKISCGIQNDLINGYSAVLLLLMGIRQSIPTNIVTTPNQGLTQLEGKLLYMGIRNKFCSVCSVANNKGVPPKQHTRFLKIDQDPWKLVASMRNAWCALYESDWRYFYV